MEISKIRPNNLPLYTRRIVLLGVAFIGLAALYGYRDHSSVPSPIAAHAPTAIVQEPTQSTDPVPALDERHLLTSSEDATQTVSNANETIPESTPNAIEPQDGHTDAVQVPEAVEAHISANVAANALDTEEIDTDETGAYASADASVDAVADAGADAVADASADSSADANTATNPTEKDTRETDTNTNAETSTEAVATVDVSQLAAPPTELTAVVNDEVPQLAEAAKQLAATVAESTTQSDASPIEIATKLTDESPAEQTVVVTGAEAAGTERTERTEAERTEAERTEAAQSAKASAQVDAKPIEPPVVAAEEPVAVPTQAPTPTTAQTAIQSAIEEPQQGATAPTEAAAPSPNAPLAQADQVIDQVKPVEPAETVETAAAPPIKEAPSTPQATPQTTVISTEHPAQSADQATAPSLTPLQVAPGQVEFERRSTTPQQPVPETSTPKTLGTDVPDVIAAAAPDTTNKAVDASEQTEVTQPESQGVQPEAEQGPPAPVAALAGRFPGKLVMLVFWSSDAQNITDTFNWLNNMHDQYSGRGLQILAVNQDATPRDGEVFAVKNGAQFSVIYDRDRALRRALWVSKLPATYLLNDKGVLLASHLGFVDDIRGNYEDEVRRLLESEL